MNGRIEKTTGWLLTVGALGMNWATPARAVETCPSNAAGPSVCVDWDQTGTPSRPLDFDVDYFTDPANPNVTLKAGAGWNVRSKNADNTSGNLGDIKIDPTVVTAAFAVKVANGSNPGAVNLKSAVLKDQTEPINWTGHSSIAVGSNIAGDLTGDLEVVSSGGAGGAVALTIGGSVFGLLTVPIVQVFENIFILGNVEAGAWMQVGDIRRVGPDRGRLEVYGDVLGDVNIDGLSGDFRVYNDVQEGATIKIDLNPGGVAYLTYTLFEEPGLFAGRLSLDSGIPQNAMVHMGTLAPSAVVSLKTGDILAQGMLWVHGGGQGQIIEVQDVHGVGSAGGLYVADYGYVFSGTVSVASVPGDIGTIGGDFAGLLQIAGNMDGRLRLLNGESLLSGGVVHIGGALNGYETTVEGNMEGALHVDGNINGPVSVVGQFDVGADICAANLIPTLPATPVAMAGWHC